MRHRYLTLPIIALLAACQPGARDEPRPVDLTPRCGADRLRGLIGQDAATLREVDLPRVTRVVRPGMALTMDYRPDRLNISIDENGIIDRVWCT
ncbi:I78 family peptidase inhibitor [uncultured Aliiroseovarius sp.]|uniref:I78 family peptidase inhibitor n=1 Tax=uncultured Aliiroseovarius sp. TaxID=1658783 RepID=UPI0026156413|nr:I78 family peptidase inhibitor [uncultured Aliiroseovarius sp.]